jgi:ribonuclease BN (tRNA processing enzyme)
VNDSEIDIEFVEIEMGSEQRLGPINVTTFPAVHPPETNPASVQVAVDEKIIAFTGDGEWTSDMPALASGADLLIAECYFYEKPVKFHLNYQTLKEGTNLTPGGLC